MDWRFLITIISTVVLGIATIVLALKLVKKRKPVWAYKTTPIIGIGSNAPPELKLIFNGRPVDDVYRTLVIFFNAGNQTIEASDVRKQVTLVFNSARILREPKLNANDTATEFSAKWSTSGEHSEVKLDFKCLDHNDGAVIEVIHDGKGKVSCEGSIKETKKITSLGDFAPSDRKQFPHSLIGGLVATFLFLGIILWGVIRGGIEYITEPGNLSMTIMLCLVFGLMLWANLRVILRRRRFPAWSAISE
jgi:hypothetical protein